MFQFFQKLFRRSAVKPNGQFQAFYQTQQTRPPYYQVSQSVQAFNQTGQPFSGSVQPPQSCPIHPAFWSPTDQSVDLTAAQPAGNDQANGINSTLLSAFPAGTSPVQSVSPVQPVPQTVQPLNQSAPLAPPAVSPMSSKPSSGSNSASAFSSASSDSKPKAAASQSKPNPNKPPFLNILDKEEKRKACTNRLEELQKEKTSLETKEMELDSQKIYAESQEEWFDSNSRKVSELLILSYDFEGFSDSWTAHNRKLSADLESDREQLSKDRSQLLTRLDAIDNERRQINATGEMPS